MIDRVLLGVFAHPDDETSCSAALMQRYAAEGIDIYVITATRGEQGALGTGGVVISREDLPAVREAEQRLVFKYLGVTNPPIYLGYRDQEVGDADREEVVLKVLAVMERVKPDVVLAFGPTGLSNHVDHIAMHHAAIEAFHRYRASSGKEPRLYFWALPQHVAETFELGIEGVEVEPNIIMDVTETWYAKIQSLRMYTSQQDAQDIAAVMEGFHEKYELFHQVYPPLPAGAIFNNLFHD
jgi:LmbE family N-acetylglucosaminyl deacetylase